MHTLWSAFLPDVLPHVPGCPVPLAEHEIRRAAQHLLAGSRAWKVSLDDVDVEAGDPVLSVLPEDPKQSLVRVEQVAIDGRLLSAATVSDMPVLGGGSWSTTSGAPSRYLQISPHEIILWPTPEADASVRLTLSVQPSDTAPGIPTGFAVAFRDAIVAGAQARLMLMPGAPWENQAAGAVRAAIFGARLDSAHYQAATSFGGGRVASNPRWC